MNVDPLITIVIPCYNQASFLPACLTSVLHQSYPSFEVILINDGSTDETPLIGAAWEKKDSRFRMIHQSNQGLPATRNRGIDQAKGKFIALLDSDDLMKTDRLEKQWTAFQQNNSIDFVYSSVELVDEKGDPIGVLRRENIPPENFLAEEFFRHQIPTPSTLMGKSFCFKEQPFNEQFRLGEDYEWTLRAAHQFTFTALSIPLTSYRRHSTNMSENLQTFKKIERNILQSYGPAHILNVVEKSSYTKEEKTLLKGKILYILEEYAEALKFLKPLHSVLALFYLGNCYFEEQKFHDCRETYEKGLPSTNPALHNNLGVCLASIGKKELAKEHLEKAAALNINYLDPQKNLEALKENRLPQAFTRRELREDLMHYKNT